MQVVTAAEIFETSKVRPGYEQIPYDSYVDQIQAFSASDKALSVEREVDGPRWTVGGKGERVPRIEYLIDVARMELQARDHRAISPAGGTPIFSSMRITWPTAGFPSVPTESVDSAPPFLRKMPLDVLSREASFLYASDFRTGKNIFARGALMAADMDDRIRNETAGKKSLRDALQALLAWSAQPHRVFRTEELTEIFLAATGVDVQDILNRWMNSPTD
jgi:hypothetical protein